MPRPDLTELRTAQILDAFERCVGKAGLSGTSLTDVAQEAGVKRSILRHYVGNRDELIHALAERVVGRYHRDLETLWGSLSDGKRGEQLVAYLLPLQPRETLASILVMESLVAAADSSPRIRELMADYLEALVEGLCAQLRKDHTAAGAQACRAVAWALVSLSFNQESFAPLQLPPKFVRAARGAARRLLQTLD